MSTVNLLGNVITYRTVARFLRPAVRRSPPTTSSPVIAATLGYRLHEVDQAHAADLLEGCEAPRARRSVVKAALNRGHIIGMSSPDILPGTIVRDDYHEVQRSIQVLLNEFSAEASFRRNELAALRRQTAALRGDVAELRERIASTHGQLMLCHIDMRRITSPSPRT